MGDPITVYGIIAWDLTGPFLFTVLLEVSEKLISSQGIYLSDKGSEGTFVVDACEHTVKRFPCFVK